MHHIDANIEVHKRGEYEPELIFRDKCVVCHLTRNQALILLPDDEWRKAIDDALMSIEIAGHTDAVGTKEYNQNLSVRRALAVKNFLVKKGIDQRRVKAVGYGKSRPLASNDDEADGRELNRRVEFKVLSK